MAVSNPNVNAACLIDSERIIWSIDKEERQRETVMVLHAESYKNLKLVEKLKAEGSESQWESLSKEIQVLNEKYGHSKDDVIRMFVNGHNCSPSNVGFKLDGKLYGKLKNLFPSFTVIITGQISCEKVASPAPEWFEKRDNNSFVKLNYRSDSSSSSPIFIGKMAKVSEDSLIGKFLSSEDTSGTRLDINWQVSIEWESPPPIKLHPNANIINKIFDCESTKNLTIVVGGGYEVKCHKIVFNEHSPILAALLLSPETGKDDSTTERVELRELSKEGVEHFLRYLYGLELSLEKFTCECAWELFQVSRKFELENLEKDLKNLFLDKGFGWFKADLLLELYFYLKDFEVYTFGDWNLKERVLEIMSRIPNEIQASDEFKKLNEDDALDLVWDCWQKLCTKKSSTPVANDVNC